MRRLVLLFGLAVVGPAYGQGADETATLPRDRLILIGRFDRLTPYGSGGSGGAFWLRALRKGVLLEAGGYTSRLGGASWHYGRLGVVAVRDGRSFAGSVDLGGGGDDEESFGYFVGRAGGGWSLVPGVLRVGADAEYLDVRRARGLLGKASVDWVVSRELTVRAHHQRRVAGALRVGQTVVRADVAVTRFRLLGGFSRGTFLDRDLLLLSGDAGRQSEWFGGFAVPIRESELTLVWSTLDSPGATRHSLTASYRFELGEGP